MVSWDRHFTKGPVRLTSIFSLVLGIDPQTVYGRQSSTSLSSYTWTAKQTCEWSYTSTFIKTPKVIDRRLARKIEEKSLHVNGITHKLSGCYKGRNWNTFLSSTTKIILRCANNLIRKYGEI